VIPLNNLYIDFYTFLKYEVEENTTNHFFTCKKNMKQIHFLNNFLLFALPNSKKFFYYFVEMLCYKTMKSKFFFFTC